LRIRITQLAGLADTWKPIRHEIAVVPPDSIVQVLEDWIVVSSPDIIRVTSPIDELKLKEGDTILRYARLGEGWADAWAQGCWYKNANLDFVVEPDGGGCGSERCAGKVTKPGVQTWWVHIKLPDGRNGWMPAANLAIAD
jgi:hypothetical protein